MNNRRNERAHLTTRTRLGTLLLAGAIFGLSAACASTGTTAGGTSGPGALSSFSGGPVEHEAATAEPRGAATERPMSMRSVREIEPRFSPCPGPNSPR